jgi:hypothetical protein
MRNLLALVCFFMAALNVPYIADGPISYFNLAAAACCTAAGCYHLNRD